MSHKVMVAHPGTQYAAHLARELHLRGLLKEFHTGIGVSSEGHFRKLIEPMAKWLNLHKELQNRTIYAVPEQSLVRYPYLELKATVQHRMRKSIKDILWDRNLAFQKVIPSRSIVAVDIVIGYDTSSAVLIKRVKSLGKKYIIDQSIAHPVLSKEVSRHVNQIYPEWRNTWIEKPEREIDNEAQEHQMTDLIVVPSRFVANSLISNGVDKDKIRINPFGTDITHFKPAINPPATSPLIFIFVGSVNARKGIPLLFQAWEKLNPRSAELWVAGGGVIPDNVVNQLHPGIKLLGRISREELPSILQRTHVFVFPSFFEGLAQVQLEAAACGLPIIGTTASGAEEIVEEGRTGFIIEPGNLDQLIEKIQLFLETPTLAIEMHKLAKDRALSWSWSAYGDRWETILNEFR